MTDTPARARPPTLPRHQPLTPRPARPAVQLASTHAASRTLDWAKTWPWTDKVSASLERRLDHARQVAASGSPQAVAPTAGSASSTLDVASAPPSRAIRWLPPVLAGSLGFVVGAIFWHLIGFWGFVAQVVTGPAGERQKVERVAAPSADETQALPRPPLRLRTLSAVFNCTMAAKNATAPVSQALPCPVNSSEPAEGEGIERADRLPVRAAPSGLPTLGRAATLPSRLAPPADLANPNRVAPVPSASASAAWATSVNGATAAPE